MISARLTLMWVKKGLTLMPITNVRERTAGFRDLTNLELAIVSGGLDPLPGDDGPPIIVTGSPYGVSQDWLDLTNSSIGDFFDQLSGNTYDPFQGHGQNEGGSGNNPQDESAEKDAKITRIPVDFDGEYTEAVEDALEEALDTLGEVDGIDVAVEFDQENGIFIAESNDGSVVGFTISGALDFIGNAEPPADPPTT